MTLEEIQAALAELKSEIGAGAYVDITIRPAGVEGYIAPSGITSKPTFFVRADGFASLIKEMHREWAAHETAHAAETTKAMALEIIRVTAESGECTDAALRMKFTAQDIEKFGSRACHLANEMAGNGPFEITTTEGSNHV